MSRSQIRFSVLTSIVLGLVAACSSSSGGSGTGATSSATKCPTYTTANTSCSQADLDAYAACPHQQCGDQLDACKSACQPQVDCVAACACDDTACRSKCTPSDDCKSCLVTAAKCTAPKCPQPACIKAGPSGADGGGGSTGSSGASSSSSSSGGSSGASSSSSGGGGSSSGGSSSGCADAGGGATCADLQACCDKIPASDSDKALCNDTVANDPSSCASELAYYQGAGKC